MPLGAITGEGSGGENIVHITGLRIRAVGSGSLNLQLISMDGIYTQDLVALPLSAATNIQPVRLANFMQQRTQLKVSVTSGGDFTINRIIIYAKPIFTMHPA